MLLKKIIIIIIVNYTIFICNFAAGKGRWSRLLEFFLGSRNAYFKWLFLNYIALRVRGLNVKFSLIPPICEQRREVGGVYYHSIECLIMANQLKYAFRLTHIDNIPYIERCGLVRADSPSRDSNYVSIGDSQVIGIRANRDVKGYRLNEYVPFYLGPRSPMLYVIQHGYNGVTRIEAENIVYCVIRLEDLIIDNIDCIFTDGHALSAFTSFYPKNMLSQIDEFVKYDDVFSSMWNIEEDRDLKRRKEAELLVKQDLPIQYVRGYVVYNETAKLRLISSGVAIEKIVVKPGYFF